MDHMEHILTMDAVVAYVKIVIESTIEITCVKKD